MPVDPRTAWSSPNVGLVPYVATMPAWRSTGAQGLSKVVTDSVFTQFYAGTPLLTIDAALSLRPGTAGRLVLAEPMPDEDQLAVWAARKVI